VQNHDEMEIAFHEEFPGDEGITMFEEKTFSNRSGITKGQREKKRNLKKTMTFKIYSSKKGDSQIGGRTKGKEEKVP